MTSSDTDRTWLAARLPFVLDQLPPAPARVLEIGCGPLGGFVPALTAAGYHALGIDPEAPEGAAFLQTTFEEYDDDSPVDVIVACTSLHHVNDLDEVLTKMADLLAPGGRVVVIEWAHELFDEATAQWSFERLPETQSVPPADHEGHHEHGDHEGGWLLRHREDWPASGQTWTTYFHSWAAEEGLHTAESIVAGLETRFSTEVLTRTPYVFADLPATTEADEQAAIDGELIRATGINYAGRRSAAGTA